VFLPNLYYLNFFSAWGGPEMLNDILTPIDCGIADSSKAYAVIVKHVETVASAVPSPTPIDQPLQAIIVALMYARYSRKKKVAIRRINTSTAYKPTVKQTQTKEAWQALVEEGELAELYKDVYIDLDEFVQTVKNRVLTGTVDLLSEELQKIRTATGATSSDTAALKSIINEIKDKTDTISKTMHADSASKKSRWKIFKSEIYWVKSLLAKPIERTATFVVLGVVGLGITVVIKKWAPDIITTAVGFLDSIIIFLKK
jgi:hypothetical protein